MIFGFVIGFSLSLSPGLRSEKYLIVEVLSSPEAGQKVGYSTSKMCGLAWFVFFSSGKKSDSATARGMKNPFWCPFFGLSAHEVSLRDSFLMKMRSLRSRFPFRFLC